MTKDVYSFWEWVENRMDQIGIASYRELESRSGFANGAISRRKNALKFPTVEMAEGMCQALRVSWVELWKEAGFIVEPPEVAEEREVVQMLRKLPPQARDAALAMLRGLSAGRMPMSALGMTETRPTNETLTEFDGSHYEAEMDRLMAELDRAASTQQREEIERRISAVSVDWLGAIWDRSPPEVWPLIVSLLRDATEKIERGEELKITGRELQLPAEQDYLTRQIALRVGGLGDEGKRAILDMIDYVRKTQSGGAEDDLDS